MRRSSSSQAVNAVKIDLPFSGIACSIILCLIMGIFMPENSIVTKFCHLALGDPVIMPHCIYKNVGLTSQGSEDVPSERTEYRHFQLPHCHLTSLSRELSQISA